MHSSLASFVSLSPQLRDRAIRSLTQQEAAELLYDWEIWARPEQLPPPGNWRTWLNCCGRGWGKTRTGAEWTLRRIRNGSIRNALVGPTAEDVRDIMVEGDSGILACSPPWYMPRWLRSRGMLIWPRLRDRGGSLLPAARARCFSAEKPGRLRGPQHETAWADELACWRYPETWDHLQFGLRLGRDPRAIVTTTPQPTALVRTLLKDPTTHTTRGSTYENKANLAAPFLDRIRRIYEGTRLGRQEIHAEVLDDAPGALWRRALLDELRITETDGKDLEFERVCVAVDPSVSDPTDASRTPEEIERLSECGITVEGLATNGHGYLLADLSGKYAPHEWAKIAVEAFDTWEADAIVAEVNNGGDLVVANIKTERRSVPVHKVRASRGKFTRAEPISSLYQQRRVHHVGYFARLEEQQCTWEPGQRSPDRLDSAVWGFTWLMVDRDPAPARKRQKTTTAHFDDTGIGL